MFTKITLDSDGVLYFHAGDTSLATAKAFTHGGIVFDPDSVTVGKMPAIPLPSDFKLEAGKTVFIPDRDEPVVAAVWNFARNLGQREYWHTILF